MAAGTNSVLEAVNTSFAIYSRAGTPILGPVDFHDFFDIPQSESDQVFDPFVSYDEVAGRFVLGIVLRHDDSDPAKQQSFIEFAVSNSSNPTSNGDFLKSHFETTETGTDGTRLWGDFPRFGWNADAYALTFNMFQFATAQSGDEGQSFDHVQVVIVSKASGLVSRSDRPPADATLVPATMHGSAPGDPMWFVQANSQGGSNVGLVEMTGLLTSSPQFQPEFSVVVPAYQAVVPPVQPGATPVTSVIDTRILNVALRGNQVVAAQNIGTGAGQTLARWYEFSIAGVRPTLVQSGDVSLGSDVDTYYPAIDIAANGDLGMSFIASSANMFMSMYVAGRTPSDPFGALQRPLLVAPGLAPYKGLDTPDGQRAGDYSGISVDPSNPNSFWAANEFARNAPPPVNWGTFIAPFSLIPLTHSFVAQVYLDLLNRQADPGGLAFWVAQLNAGVPRSEVVRQIEGSLEYRTLVVESVYHTLLGRAADPMGLTTFVNFLGADGTVEEMRVIVLHSPEYFQDRAGGTTQGFLAALYRDVLGRPIDAAGEARFTQILTLGIPVDTVITEVLGSQEKETAVVEAFYMQFLDRPADTIGLDHFTGLLRQAYHQQQPIVTSDASPAVGEKEAIAEFIGSAEFLARL